MPGICIRPIVTYIGSTLYNDNKYIDTFLKLMLKMKPTMWTFLCSHWKWGDNAVKWRHLLVHEYIANWWLKIIADYGNNEDELSRKIDIPKAKFLDLVHLVLTTTR